MHKHTPKRHLNTCTSLESNSWPVGSLERSLHHWFDSDLAKINAHRQVRFVHSTVGVCLPEDLPCSSSGQQTKMQVMCSNLAIVSVVTMANSCPFKEDQNCWVIVLKNTSWSFSLLATLPPLLRTCLPISVELQLLDPSWRDGQEPWLSVIWGFVNLSWCASTGCICFDSWRVSPEDQVWPKTHINSGHIPGL